MPPSSLLQIAERHECESGETCKQLAEVRASLPVAVGDSTLLRAPGWATAGALGRQELGGWAGGCNGCWVGWKVH